MFIKLTKMDSIHKLNTFKVVINVFKMILLELCESICTYFIDLF